MPSFELYKKIHSEDTLGRVRKNISDMLMDETFSGDVGYQVAYLYDWYHDLKSNERHKLRNLSPSEDEYKIPIEIKYLANASQTYSKDIVTYHIQMRPHQACNVDYYEKYFGKYNAIFPVGLYIDIMDNNDQYNRWMVVATANYYDAQFSTFEILPCDKVFQWVIGGEKINMAGVLRSQNSYIFVRFIGETLCRKFLNCGKLLRANMLKQKDEISLCVNAKKLLDWIIRSEALNRRTFNDQVPKWGNGNHLSRLIWC